MKNFSLIMLALAGTVLLVIGVAYRAQTVATFGFPDRRANEIVVVTTFFPLTDIVTNIAGDEATVIQVVPDGVEPHEYEPTFRQIAQAEHADIFVMLGGGIDPWGEDMGMTVEAKGGAILRMTDEIAWDGKNPHIWLDPIRVSRMAEVIAGSLIERDPGHQEIYAARLTQYLDELHTLDSAYQEGLLSCALRDVIVSHDAFVYLAERYVFTEHHILGISPEEEPSPQIIRDLALLAKQLGITMIFFETLVSPDLAETLAEEAGATTAVLNPIEGLTEVERDAGKGYVELMRENLSELRTAMLCQ